jgi:predicted Rossmann fold flavoprotein
VTQVGTIAHPEVIVIGAGAAGLWAAARAAELGSSVLLLEKTPRTGTKVLASGGTRCNLTTTRGPDAAARLFGPRGERFLRAAFRALTPARVREHFETLGVPTLEEPLEKVFPASHRARDVRDALERWARGAGARIECHSAVCGIDREGDAWRVRLLGGRRLRTRKLLVCPGGRSYPRAGTTGDGYAWLSGLGLPIVEPVPALAPLASDAEWVRELAGVSVQAVTARLRSAAGALVGERERPVVFTHKGISGPGAMDLAEPVAREAANAAREQRSPRAHALLLDLAPARDREDLRALLAELAGRSGAPLLAAALASELAQPRRLVARCLAQAGVAPDARVNALARAGRHALVEALKALAIPAHATLGFDHAEVTAGGLALSAVEPATLRVKAHAGLWVFGEILDLAGPIGGLNFQAAFATAELAARAAAGP